jgi:hypothetical protein
MSEHDVMTLREFIDEGAYVDAEGVTRRGEPPWAEPESDSQEEPEPEFEAINRRPREAFLSSRRQSTRKRR